MKKMAFIKVKVNSSLWNTQSMAVIGRMVWEVRACKFSLGSIAAHLGVQGLNLFANCFTIALNISVLCQTVNHVMRICRGPPIS